MAISSRPAKRLALASLILNIVFFVITLLLGRWSGFFAVSAVSWFILSAVLIWFVLVIQFHQRTLAEQEKLDMSQLADGKRESTIFQAGDERATLFAIAQRRLKTLEKWFLPIFAIVIAIYQLVMGLYLLKIISTPSEIETQQPLFVAICMTAIAFVSFLLSRYATGMSSQTEWKPLRAGGSCLLAAAILCFVLAIGLALAQFNWLVLVNVINYAVPILLVVLGVETALNIVLDIYRPRLKGQYSRAAFDSRLLGLINEPGEIFRTAASAIDYQFGFKVSQTWFYKLLERAIVPLVLFVIVILYLLSCIVIVAPNEEAIIEHFGNPTTKSNEVRLAGPGLTFKWPWPIDIAYKYPTKKISELSIGFVPKPDEGDEKVLLEPLLWGQEHYEEEYQLLVASESQVSDTEAIPVSLVIAAVPVQYRIKDLYSFIYKHNEPEKLLESICYHELTRFAASAKIEVNSEADMNRSLLGAGRAEAKRILTDRIQAAADEADLGVEIVFVGLQGIHPPPKVAADYQQVVGAVQEKLATILNAQAERNNTLGTLAGSVKDADELSALAAGYQATERQNDTEQIEKLGKELDTAFTNARGEIFKILRESQSYAFEKATLSKADGERFSNQLKAYRAAPQIYLLEQTLAAFEESLENIRKFIVFADQNDTQIFIFDGQEKLTPSLYEGMAGFGESSEK